MKKQTQRIKTILVPVDFSAYSQNIIDYASMIAAKFDATLILLHVIESLRYSVTDTFKVVEHRKGLQTLATSLLRNLKDEMQARKLTVKTRLVWGTASREILSEARREKPDLIVMGTHGRSGLPHAILGSVAEKIVRLSRVPVLTVPLSVATGSKKHSRSPAGA
jgi:nucleotide-binding universal stress UspA family protein